MGIMPEEIETMIAASSSRYGLATDITKEKVKETNTSEKQCEITKKVKSSIKCPEMINIKQSSPGFFKTEEGILYENT